MKNFESPSSIKLYYKFLLSEECNTNFSQLVMPFVDNVPEILIVQLICFVPSVETTGSENSQEPRVITTFLEKETRNK